MDEWRLFLEQLDAHERWLAQEVMRFVVAEMRLAGARSKGNAERVTEAHLRIDHLGDAVDRNAQAIDDIQQALAQMALEAERCKQRQVGDDDRAERG